MSVRKWLINFVLAFVLLNSVCAQDSLKYSTLALGIGFNAISNKDLFQSPYTYRGTNPILNAIYTRVRAKGQHLIELSYSGGHIKSIVSPQAENKLLVFNYGYLFNLRRNIPHKKLIPSLGIGIHSFLSNTNYLPTIELPQSYTSGSAYLTLNGSVLYRLNKKSNARVQIGLPLFGFVYRPDFEINGQTLTKTTLPGKNNLFSLKLEYEYKLTSKLRLTATYNYNYFTFEEPRPITILQNSLLIGVRKVF